ncbi:MAG: DUF933 domain-containing protein, partial [bacterium]
MTIKPMLYIANVSEDVAQDQKCLDDIRSVVSDAQVVPICARLESDVEDLNPEEAQEYLKEVGIAESGLAKLIRIGYKMLDLVTFFTANDKEAHAWTIKRGSRAPQAAGKVHSDMEKGFIRAEVVNCEVLEKSGSIHKAKEEGHLRMEGKEYIVKDGDIIYYHFKP